MSQVLSGVEEVVPVEVAPPVKRTRRQQGASLWRYLRISLSAALFILMLGLAVLAIVLPAVTGSVPMTVLTQSMEPKYPPGTLIIVKPVDPDDIRIGDVVTYQIKSGEPAVITHRVISITTTTAGERSFIVKGDNNAEADDPIKDVQIRGRLWYALPLLGWVNTWVNGDNRAWIAPIIAGGLFLYALWMVISGIRDRGKKKRAAKGGRGRRAAGIPAQEAEQLEWPTTPSASAPDA